MRRVAIGLAFAAVLAGAFWWPEVTAAGRDALDHTLDTYLTLYVDGAGLRTGCLF